MVRTAGLEPAISGQGFGFRGRCVYQFRHVRKNTNGERLSRSPFSHLVDL